MALFFKSKTKKEKINASPINASPAVVKTTAKFGDAKHLSLTLKKNWITEKSYRLANENKYVFIVDKNANKPEVKKAVEHIYGVQAEDVKIINYRSKIKKFGRGAGKVPGFKKAIVQLKEGNKIEI